jgi:NAD(P)H-nitrite reductase large subunit
LDRLRHVIIGSSAAGTKAAETLRRLRPEDDITVISDEANPLYSRCLLPHLLGETRDEDGIRFRPGDFFSRWRLNRVLGAGVTAVEPHRSRVIIQDNSTLEYDRLLIATGSSSFIPPVPGLAGPRVLGLRTLDDARRIGALAQESRRVVIVGAGFVGLEVAYALRRRGLEVTVVEKLPGILPQQMDHEAAGIIQEDIEGAGVRLVLGTGILQVRDGGGGSLRVILEDERVLEAGFVIVAAGTRPNVGFLDQSGIHVERGIPVDGQMSTNVQGVYAAGDVAVTVDAVTGSAGLTPIWPNAVVQGRVAGFNMAGKNRLYSSQIALQNAVEFQDVPAVSLGLSRAPGEGYEVISVYNPSRGIYRKMVLREDTPVGMILVGDIRQSGVVASLIRRKRPLAEDLKEAFLHGNLHTGHLLSFSTRRDRLGQG